MSDYNPYAAPETDIKSVVLDMHLLEEGGLWRDGKVLVVRKFTDFLDRCLKCNAPAEGYRLKKTLSWHNPFFFVLIVSPLIYIIVALIVRKTAKIRAPLCPRHRSKRRRAIALGWFGCLAGIGVVCLGAPLPDYAGTCATIGAIMFLGFLIFGIAGSNYLVPKRIDKNFAWLRKVSLDFLAELPEWA